MKIVKSSEWLISENKAGLQKFWRLHILQSKKNFYTQTEWYQITTTGRKSTVQLSEPYMAVPTNVGRANERNSEEQAYFEFDSILKKQKDKGYRKKGEKKQERPMPMLAHKFKDHKGKVEFPVYAQPKLNGMRMLFDGSEGWSRGNKELISEVIQHLHTETLGNILDGELMLPNNVLLQESMKAIKKYRPELSPQLLYHVYDIVDPTRTFEERMELIETLSAFFPENVVMVPTVLVHNETEVMFWHNTWTKAGFEGTMIRDPKAGYEAGKRSYSLLKLKDFVDEEFKIIGFEQGNGSFAESIIFICESNGKPFNVVPEGTMEHKKSLWKKRNSLMGKWLTVRYFEKSKDGIPIFPVGVDVRDSEDF